MLNENNNNNEGNALYEPPTFEAMGNFREATGWLVVSITDPYSSYGLF
jgi:hypothetical protein